MPSWSALYPPKDGVTVPAHGPQRLDLGGVAAAWLDRLLGAPVPGDRARALFRCLEEGQGQVPGPGGAGHGGQLVLGPGLEVGRVAGPGVAGRCPGDGVPCGAAAAAVMATVSGRPRTKARTVRARNRLCVMPVPPAGVNWPIRRVGSLLPWRQACPCVRGLTHLPRARRAAQGAAMVDRDRDGQPVQCRYCGTVRRRGRPGLPAPRLGAEQPPATGWWPPTPGVRPLFSGGLTWHSLGRRHAAGATISAPTARARRVAGRQRPALCLAARRHPGAGHAERRPRRGGTRTRWSSLQGGVTCALPRGTLSPSRGGSRRPRPGPRS